MERTTETSWRRSIKTLLGVSFETCLRRRGDVMVGRRCYVLLRRRYDIPIRRRGDAPLRRLGDVPSRRRWVFHLRRTCDVTGTYRETLLRRRHEVLMPGGYSITDNLSKTLQRETISSIEGRETGMKTVKTFKSMRNIDSADCFFETAKQKVANHQFINESILSRKRKSPNYKSLNDFFHH